MEGHDILAQQDQMVREHAAWLDVGIESKRLGFDLNDPRVDPLARAIKKWGEELHLLRMADPKFMHAENALREARAAYEGQYERGEYPKGPSDDS